MLAALLLLLACPAPGLAPNGAPNRAQHEAPRAAGSADEQPGCPYAFDRKRQLWLFASQVPRYVYYRLLEPGDGTLRASMMVRVTLEEDSIREVTFEAVERIEGGASTLCVALKRTIADERAGLELSEPTRIALTVTRGADEEPLRLVLVGSEVTRHAGWIYETTTFEPDVAGAVALVDARELALSGPGQGWMPAFDDTDRAALRYFLWHHAAGGRAALEASAKRRADEAAASADEVDGETERDG